MPGPRRWGPGPSTRHGALLGGTAGRLLVSLAVVGGLGSLAGIGTFSSVSSGAARPAPAVTGGSISDDDAGEALFEVESAAPGVTHARCIAVRYRGEGRSTARLYMTGAAVALAPDAHLTISAGTQAPATFPGCAGFAPASGPPLFSGNLAAFADGHRGYDRGLATAPRDASGWSRGDVVVYRFALTVADRDGAQGRRAGPFAVSWHAEPAAT